MRRRLSAILLVALLAAPGTWLRTPPRPAIERPANGYWDLLLQPITVKADDIGEARLAGAWVLESEYPGFGGYSALVTLGDGLRLAGSDMGRMLVFAPPGNPPGRAVMDQFASRPQPDKHLVDIEGMTRDPVSGRIWVAYEGRNAIERFEPEMIGSGTVRPQAMAGWPGNTGPETLLRLTDGRFIVLSESRLGWLGGGHPALLFPGDPVEGGEPMPFVFETGEGFRPVDAAQLPDGRVAVLLRRFDWILPEFNTRVVIADPGEIRQDRPWRGRPIATIDRSGPSENYEGIAAEELAGGVVRLWLISDHNRSDIQRTQLLELHWGPNGKRPRGSPARPLD